MSGFFVTGGTIKPGTPSYIERAADAELYSAVLAGEYCSVLTTRQMGKSSLMARTAARLREVGIACATVDLQGRGEQTPAAEQWYFGLVKQIADGLGLTSGLSEWWKQQTLLLPSQRMIDFFGDVALRQIAGRVVVFIDEVDWLIRLPFSDEFFAAIRSCFNRRATDAAFERLTFVLLGSAAPAQLIKEATRTPFNIGRGIELTDFTPVEAAPLARQLGDGGARILTRVLYWTDGHPYLTQMLCAKVAERAGNGADPETLVDAIVEDKLLSTSAREEENNLKFVSDRLTQGTDDLRRVLRTYRDVLHGKSVVDVPASPIHTSLRLSGVVKPDSERRLRVRNLVYGRVFDERWVRQRLPSRTAPAAVAAAVAALATSALWLAFYQSPQQLPVRDEAVLAGRDATTFPAADEDYFHDMDGGISLTPEETKGRNTWIVWSAGNDRFWDRLSVTTFGAVDLLKTISSHPTLNGSRDNRWEYLGLVNEPCFDKAIAPDQARYGLWLDHRSKECPPDPFERAEKYPGVAIGARGTAIERGSFFGFGTGIVGLRLFPNPDFDAKAAGKWDAARYYTDPAYYSSSKLIKPYRVGMTCAFCHVGPNPGKPPADPTHPRWENLSSNVGAQYFRMDRIFNWKAESNTFVFQLLHSARPGSLDTSLISTDNINNPRTMNALYLLSPRLMQAHRWGRETLSGGGLNNSQFNDYAVDELIKGFQSPDTVWTPRMLKDGADSVGELGALNRFYINTGTFSEEWLLHFNPLFGLRPITPITLLTTRKNSFYFKATETQTMGIARFFFKATASHKLADAPGGNRALSTNEQELTRGKIAYADNCAACHSSRTVPPPVPGLDPAGCAGKDYLHCFDTYWTWTKTQEFKEKMRRIVLAKDFLIDNYLSAEFRVPVTLLQTNACSPLAANAIGGNIWDNFSSQSYKDLPSVGNITWYHPYTGAPGTFAMPAGGRGYSRPPSLVSLWSTAPYLLNNSVGPFESSPSVEARLRSFQASIEQMLWPEKREKDSLLGDKIPGRIDRTTEPTYLWIGGGYVPDILRSLLRTRPREQGIRLGPIPAGTPINLLANLGLSGDSDPLARAQRAGALSSMINKIANDLAALPKNATDAAAENVFKGVADRLLALSECPDFIVNRGHFFGTTLPDQDKRALIEFLKTF